jgi:hypothetical protein
MLEDTAATWNPQTYIILVGVIQFALCHVFASATLCVYPNMTCSAREMPESSGKSSIIHREMNRFKSTSSSLANALSMSIPTKDSACGSTATLESTAISVFIWKMPINPSIDYRASSHAARSRFASAEALGISSIRYSYSSGGPSCSVNSTVR